MLPSTVNKLKTKRSGTSIFLYKYSSQHISHNSSTDLHLLNVESHLRTNVEHIFRVNLQPTVINQIKSQSTI